MKINLVHICAGIILFSSLVSEAGRPPPKVKINKCCRIGEYMNRSQVCVAGSSKNWVPLIFLINRAQSFSPRGGNPNFMSFEESTRPKECQGHQLEAIFGGDKIVLFSNGSLFLNEKSTLVGIDDYCVDSEAALVCFRHLQAVDSLTAPKKKTKVRKCCAPNAIYDNQHKKTCIYQQNSNAQIAIGTSPSSTQWDVFNTTDVERIFGFPDCNTTYAIVSSFNRELFDTESGKLTITSGKEISSDEFCLEHTVGGDEETASLDIFTCSHHISTSADDWSEGTDEVHFAVLSAGLFISVMFLAAALGAGFLMPSVHYVLHWQCQIYYIFCLLVGDLLLAIIQVSRDSLNESACIVLAVCTHFFFLAAFFWLNTMCFNIWWTFRDFRPSSLEKNQELFRLRLFRVYAWGLSLIIAATAAILEHTSESDFLKPGFGMNCWFKGNLEIFAFFFGPIGILLCVNLVLFASTARQLTCGLWKRDDVKSTTERTALGKVCLKLVVVMGVTWMADILSWLIGGPKYVWYFTDFINALQGVFIFIVVGCQPQVWAAIKRIWTTKTRQEATNTTNAVQHSSSSNGLPSIGDTITNNTVASDNATKIPMETVC